MIGTVAEQDLRPKARIFLPTPLIPKNNNNNNKERALQPYQEKARGIRISS